MNKGVSCITLPPGVSRQRLEALKVALPHAVAQSFSKQAEEAERRDTRQQLAKENITWQLE